MNSQCQPSSTYTSGHGRSQPRRTPISAAYACRNWRDEPAQLADIGGHEAAQPGACGWRTCRRVCSTGRKQGTRNSTTTPSTLSAHCLLAGILAHRRLVLGGVRLLLGASRGGGIRTIKDEIGTSDPMVWHGVEGARAAYRLPGTDMHWEIWGRL